MTVTLDTILEKALREQPLTRGEIIQPLFSGLGDLIYPVNQLFFTKCSFHQQLARMVEI